MGELASGASFHVGDSGEVSLGAVRQQWRSKTKGSRTELLQLLRDGLAAYVVYVVHVATVRASKSTLPSLGAAPPKLANHEDEGAMMRDGFEFMVEMCNTDSVPEAPQYLASAGAVAAVLEASLLHSVTFPEDDATVEFALGAVVALLQEEGQDVIALEKGALRLAARVRAGAPAKAKEVHPLPLCNAVSPSPLRPPFVRLYVLPHPFPPPYLLLTTRPPRPSPTVLSATQPTRFGSTPGASSSPSPCGRAPRRSKVPRSSWHVSSKSSRGSARTARR